MRDSRLPAPTLASGARVFGREDGLDGLLDLSVALRNGSAVAASWRAAAHGRAPERAQTFELVEKFTLTIRSRWSGSEVPGASAARPGISARRRAEPPAGRGGGSYAPTGAAMHTSTACLGAPGVKPGDYSLLTTVVAPHGRRDIRSRMC